MSKPEASKKTIYLSERPFGSQDHFEHEQVAKTLAQIAVDHGGKFCVGLLGKYGVGKSFILDRVAELLLLEKSVRVFRFDAWQYSDEPVQRGFIDALIGQADEITPDQNQKLLSRLYHSTNRPIKPILAVPTYVKVCLGLVVIGTLALSAFHLFKTPGPIWPVLVNAVLSVGLLGSLKALFDVFRFVQGTHATAWESLSIPAAVSTAQFEKVFSDLLNDVLRTNQHAVMLIDEVDRCSEEERLAIFKALRTYLRHKRCFYIVASAPEGLDCTDDPALHRKLFQVSYTLDPPNPERLRRYSSSLLAATRFQEFGQDLVDVIYLCNTREPRNVIHFINTLLFAADLADRHNEVSVSQNPCYLAKILGIRRDWKEIFDQIVERPGLLKEWSKVLQDGVPAAFPPDFQRFLRITDHIKSKDPRPFLAIAGGLSPRLDSQNDQLSMALDSLDIELCLKLTSAEGYPEWSSAVLAHIRQHERAAETLLHRNSLLAACSVINNVPGLLRRAYASDVLSTATSATILGTLDAGSAIQVVPVSCLARSEDATVILNWYGRQFQGRESHPGIATAMEENHSSLPVDLREAFWEGLLPGLAAKTAKERVSQFKLLFGDWPKVPAAIKPLISPKVVEEVSLFHVQIPDESHIDSEIDKILFHLRPAWSPRVFRSVVGVHIKRLQESGQPNNLSPAQIESLDRLNELANEVSNFPDKLHALEVACSSLERLGAPNLNANEAVTLMSLVLVASTEAGVDGGKASRRALTHFLSIFPHQLTSLAGRLASATNSDAVQKTLLDALRALPDLQSSAVRPILSTLKGLAAYNDYFDCCVRFFQLDVDFRRNALKEACESANELTDDLLDRLAAHYCEMVVQWENAKSRREDMQRLLGVITKDRVLALSSFGKIGIDVCLVLAESRHDDDIRTSELLFDLVGLGNPDPGVRTQFVEKFVRRLRKNGTATRHQLKWCPAVWAGSKSLDGLLDVLRSSLALDSGVRAEALEAIGLLKEKRKQLDGSALAETLIEDVRRGGLLREEATAALNNVVQVAKISPPILKKVNELRKDSK